jgi:hypothetical protein
MFAADSPQDGPAENGRAPEVIGARWRFFRELLAPGYLLFLVVICAVACAAEPPAVNPFGQGPSERDDAVPGYVELSDGTIHAGLIYLTRDKRLKIYDETIERQREIPLRVVRQIDCAVKKEWMEREWKYKETTSDEKLYTGRSYPAREYLHTITLRDGRTITGPLAEIVYVQPPADDSSQAGQRHAEPKVERFLLSKRAKGELGQKLTALLYVKRIKLGKDALEEGRKKASESNGAKSRAAPPRPRSRGVP